MQNFTFIIISLIASFEVSVYAQITFQKTYPGAPDFQEPKYISEDIRGGYLMLSTYLNTENYFIRTDVDGEVIWNKSYRVNNLMFRSHAFVQTADTGYLLVGDIETGPNNEDIAVIKVDKDGNVLQSSTYGTAAQDGLIEVDNSNPPSRDMKIYPTTDNGFIITSVTSGYGTRQAAYLLKLNGAGILQWSRVYKRANTSDDYCVALVPTSDGNFTMLSNYFQTGESGVSLWRLDSDGMPMWTKHYNINTIKSGNDPTGNIVLTPDGGYAFSGAGIFPQYAYVVKTDASGNVEWLKGYETSPNDDVGMYLNNYSDGGLIITSKHFNYSQGCTVFKTDDTGRVEWGYGYSDVTEPWGDMVIETKDKGFLISAVDRRDRINPAKGAMLIKTDSMGESNCIQQPVLITVENIAFTEFSNGIDDNLVTTQSLATATSTEPTITIENICPFTVIAELEVNTNPIVCGNDSLLVRAIPNEGTPPYSFLWSPTGKTGDSIYLKAGQHIVIAVDAASDTARDTLFIEGADTNFTISAGEDFSICPNTDTTLKARFAEGIPTGEIDSLMYIWNEGEGNDSIFNISPDTTTTYYVDAFDSIGCKASDTITITVLDAAGLLPPDTTITICEGDSVQLMVETSEDIVWLPNENLVDTSIINPIVSPGITSIFTAYKISDCGNDTINFNITVEDCESFLYMPNAFSPNSDGDNETYGATGTGLENYNLSIYDFRGSLIFSANNINKRWDGTRNGKDMPAEVYVYKLSAIISQSGDVINQTGTFTLLR